MTEKEAELNREDYSEERLKNILNNPKEFMREIIFKRLEQNKDHNLFTNYNNFSRDEWVFNVTFDECFFFFEELMKERFFFEKARNYFSQQYFKKCEEINKLKAR